MTAVLNQATRRTRRRRATVDVVPGLLVCVAATGVAMAVNWMLPTLSPLLIAILAGAIVANTTSIPQRLAPGIDFSARRLLRLGVALLGLQLMLDDIVGLGWRMLVVVVAIVGLGVAGSLMVGKWLGIAYPQRILIACGFSVCGAAAVAGVDGVVDAKEEEVATSVALVVVFGTVMIPLVPVSAHLLGLTDEQAGMWAGGAIHEVAQVVAAGGAIGTSALAVAVVVKLARVMMLAPLMAALSIRERRRIGPDASIKRPPLVPLFVVGFLACVALRSSGVVPDDVLAAGKIAQTALLTASMFALGLGVRLSTLRLVGGKPVALAAISTVWVSAIALVGVLLAS